MEYRADCEKCVHGKCDTGHGMRIKDGYVYMNSSGSITCTAGIIERIDLSADGMYCSSFMKKQQNEI